MKGTADYVHETSSPHDKWQLVWIKFTPIGLSSPRRFKLSLWIQQKVASSVNQVIGGQRPPRTQHLSKIQVHIAKKHRVVQWQIRIPGSRLVFANVLWPRCVRSNEARGKLLRLHRKFGVLCCHGHEPMTAVSLVCYNWTTKPTDLPDFYSGHHMPCINPPFLVLNLPDIMKLCLDLDLVHKCQDQNTSIIILSQSPTFVLTSYNRYHFKICNWLESPKVWSDTAEGRPVFPAIQNTVDRISSYWECHSLLPCNIWGSRI